VGFTWVLSLVVFLPLAVVAVFLVRRLGRRQGFES
jgi:membrane protein implicated in regulation of membrane protease activity